MPNLTVSVGHRLPQDEALRRIRIAIAQLGAQYADKIGDLHENWNGYTGAFLLSAMNQQASGTLTVNPADVTLQATLPLLALGFNPVIESKIREVLTRILA